MKKLFLILIAFFSVSVFSQDPFDRKQREQTEYPKEGLTLPRYGSSEVLLREDHRRNEGSKRRSL